MLRGATWSAAAIVGTAVFKIVVSSDSMKNATATSHGSSRLLEAASGGGSGEIPMGPGGLAFGGLGCMASMIANQSSFREKFTGRTESMRRKRLARRSFVTHGETVDNGRCDGSGLLQVVFQNVVVGIHVGVRSASVVAFHIVPNPLETRQADFIE